MAVEIDPVLAAELPKTIADRAPEFAALVDVVTADALGVGEAEVGQPTVLAANLPYNVAVPVLLTLLAALPSLDRGIVMVQAEVADRMCAGPGSRVYGAPSAKLAWYASARPAGTVPRTVFWPVPNVDSKLVAFTRHAPPATTASRAEVFAVIDAAFGQRRKTLRAALGGWAGSPVAAERLLRAAGVDPGARGEALAIERLRSHRAGPPRRRAPRRPTSRITVIVTSVTARVPAKINLQLAVGPLRRRRLPRAGDGLPRHLAVRRGDRRGRHGRQRDRGRRGRRSCARRRGQPGAARGAGAARGDRGP